MVGNADGNMVLSKCNGLLITLPISCQLQDPSLDLTKCIEMIKTVLIAFKSKREAQSIPVFLIEL